ncbi:amidohydrolase family protein [Actinoplanes regularis]|uniref:L-fuconolactonase n=1 Tax=Actinoplanes regularis TaxID=52697 RepID=A0A239FHY6_9ACTN|nr:amidohydrolase family protein [Actinoplanes regularis]GIE89610.1 amidohydrolase [Actinoplanes regularis]SNS56519.1 L-fuconolactonase [Actinoplanes regularis]
MIVDAHHHLWTADYPWLAADGLAPIRRDYTMADLRPHLAAAGVQRTVLVEGGLCRAAETSRFLALAAHTPEIAGVVGWADLADPDLRAMLARHRSGPGGDRLVGVRDQVQAGPDDLLDQPGVRAGLATVADAGLVNELVVRAGQLPAVARAAAALPESTFVLDHLGKPPIGDLAGWLRLITPVAARPNVVAKLSGLVTEAGPGWTRAGLRPYVQAALELFGPDRLMFGSDWPVCEVVATYEEVVAVLTGILGGRPADVFGRTATRVYRLEHS